MRNTKRKRALRACLIFASTLCLGLTNTVVYAAESVDSLESTTSELQRELDSLNAELNSLNADIDSILEKIETTTIEVDQTKIELANAKKDEESQYTDMKLRIKYMYEEGNQNFLHMLLESKNMADFLNKADFITSVSKYDREMLAELQATRKTIAKKETSLKEEQESLVALKSELENKEAALNAKVSSTSGELSAYAEKLAQAKAAEEAAQAALDMDTTYDGQVGGGGGSNPPDISYGESVGAGAGELDLLAALLECEAGSVSYEGCLAVASVVMNRVRSSRFPNTITEVIQQPGQFTPYASGKLASVLSRGAAPVCYQAANDALAGANNVGGCLFFWAASTGHYGTIIGGNVFW